MIPATELRIGNWVRYMDSAPHKIGLSDFFTEAKGERSWFQHLMPIPITSEMLLRAGFVQYPDVPWFEIEIDDEHSLWWEDDSLRIECRDDYYNIYLPHIRYVHQLQNLYFSLTGRELNIDL